MNRFLFLIIPNNCGSSILYRKFAELQNVVPLSLGSAKPRTTGYRTEFLEAEKLIFHIFESQADACMPVPAYHEHHNAHAEQLVPGIGRIWASGEYLKTLTERENYDWPRIKDLWQQNWMSHPEYSASSILTTKSPTSPSWARMLPSHFDNARFILSIREPYAMCAGIRNAVRGNQGVDIPIETCVDHWIGLATLQMENSETIDHSLVLTYEELCRDQEKARGKIAEFFPEVADVDLSVMQDRGKGRVKLLTRREKKTIGSRLQPHLELLDYFGYAIR
jgi:hypothetical protein